MRPIKREKSVRMTCPMCGHGMFRDSYLDCGNVLEESYKCNSCGHTSRVKSRMC